MKFFGAKNKKGESLIETLLYVSLFALLSIVFINCLTVMTKSFIQTKSNDYLLDSGYSSMERISREIRGAISVDATSTLGSNLASTSNFFLLNTTDSNNSAKTVKFDVSSGALRLTENSVVTGNLTGGNVTVSNLVFRSITTANSKAVKIEMTLTDNRISTRAENFYDTVVLRTTY